MNKVFIVVWTVLAVAVIGWYFFWPSDEARVRDTFREVAAALEKNGSEDNMEAVRKAKRATAFVEPGCTFELVDGENSKSFMLSSAEADITQGIVAFRMKAGNLKVEFKDMKVKFSNETTAEVTCDFVYKGDDFGWAVRDARALDATLRKDPQSGRWRFAGVSLSNIIEK